MPFNTEERIAYYARMVKQLNAAAVFYRFCENTRIVWESRSQDAQNTHAWYTHVLEHTDESF